MAFSFAFRAADKSDALVQANARYDGLIENYPDAVVVRDQVFSALGTHLEFIENPTAEQDVFVAITVDVVFFIPANVAITDGEGSHVEMVASPSAFTTSISVQVVPSV